MIHPLPAPTPAEIEEAVRWSRRRGARYAARMPAHLDREAFVGEAVCAVATALGSYDPARGGRWQSHVACTVWRALQDETRRQEPLGRKLYGRVRDGEERPPAAVPPVSLDALCRLVDEEPLTVGECLPSPAPGPEAVALARDEARRTRELLRLLPSRTRRLFVLKLWEEWTDTAAAREVGVSPSRVQQLLHEGRERLRQAGQAGGKP